VLLLRPNEVVPAEQLIDALWGERPPPTASTMVQVYVSRLRKLLGRDLLLTRPAGYELALDPSQTDVGRFEALLAAAAGTDDTAEAARLLNEALALWRGPALADFAYESFASVEAGRLEELRLAALDDRVDADLALGRHAELVPELEALVAEQPLRERARGQLMLALYRAGRQAEALEVHRAGQRLLVEQLGLEPGPALRVLERQILDQDPALDPSAPEPQRPAGDERKVVTALFADLAGSRGSGLDPEDARAVLEPCLAQVRAELERFGGTVETLVGGTVAAVFGAPVAHEDDPERAVRAGLSCRELVASAERAQPGLRLELRVAVDTGEVLVTSHGGSTRDGHVVGEALSTADRLRATAPPNSVLVTDLTYRATAAAIDYCSGDAMTAPGRPEPIPVWQALAPKAAIRTGRASARQVALVGRDDELDLLRTRLLDVRAGRGADLVTLVGAPGIGKSRLVREAAQAAEGFRWLQGRSIPYGDGVAYWAFAEVVKTVAGILDTDAPAAAGHKLRQAVRQAVADEPDSVEEQLRVLLGLEARDPASERSAAFAAWRRYLVGLARAQPLVLALEDVHWADDGLLDFVEHLRATATEPLFLLCTARPELLERRPGWPPVVELTPLNDDDTRCLLSALLGRESLPEELEPVVSRVGGNPLFAEEYASAVADGGTGAVLLPDSVHHVIAARLDALAPETKALLQDAAVVGKVFWSGALSVLGDLGRESSGRVLDELGRRGLIEREPHSAFAGEAQYAFKHVLIRDVAYGGIPRAARATKHRLTAEWMESRARDDDVAELLAHHYGSALELATAAGLETEGLAERASEAFWRAGERARQLHANAEAIAYFRRALALFDAAPAAEKEWRVALSAAVLETLGDVLELTGEHGQGEDAFAGALALHPRRDRLRRARLLRKQAASRQLQRRIDDSAAVLAAAEDALGRRPAGGAWWEERCEIALQRLQLLYFSAPTEAVLDGEARDRPLVESHGTAEQRSRLYGWMGMAAVRAEVFAPSERTIGYLRTALAAARDSGSAAGVPWLQFGLGFGLLWAWQLDEAAEQLAAALALMERVGDLTNRTRCLNYLTVLMRRSGDVDGTRRFADLTLEAAEATHMDEYVVQAKANRAWIARREGDRAGAEMLARAAWDGWDGYMMQRVIAWEPVWPLLELALPFGPCGRGSRARRRAARPDPAADASRSRRGPARGRARGRLRAGRALRLRLSQDRRAGEVAHRRKLAPRGRDRPHPRRREHERGERLLQRIGRSLRLRLEDLGGNVLQRERPARLLLEDLHDLELAERLGPAELDHGALGRSLDRRTRDVAERDPAQRVLARAEDLGLRVRGVEADGGREPDLREIGRAEDRRRHRARVRPLLDGALRPLERAVRIHLGEGDEHEAPDPGRLGGVDEIQLPLPIDRLDRVALAARDRRGGRREHGLGARAGRDERGGILQVALDELGAELAQLGDLVRIGRAPDERADRPPPLGQEPTDLPADQPRGSDDEVRHHCSNARSPPHVKATELPLSAMSRA
jgi:DNA-binding SARP family transcriptional activator